MRQLTRDEAIAFAESGAWQKMTDAEISAFQIEQECLCMPFHRFQQAMEQTLGRPVFTHEFGLNLEGLKAELEGRATAPTLEQIIALVPDALIVVA